MTCTPPPPDPRRSGRQPATQVPALLAGLGRHRGADPDPGPALPLRLDPQRGHHRLVPLGLEVDQAAGLRHPQLHAVMLEQRRHQGVLAAVERPLILPHHDRVERAIRVGHRRHQCGGLRPARPGQHPALPDVEEPGPVPPVPGDQRTRLVALPGPGRDRILVILGGHASVEREPQPATARFRGRGAAPRALCPREQPVCAYTRIGGQTRTLRRHNNPPLPVRREAAALQYARPPAVRP
jgi:hypothetical protein